MKKQYLCPVNLILMITVLGCLITANCQGGKGKMTLHASLDLPKTTLLYQEDLPCILVLENKGATAVKIIPPRMATSVPILRLTDMRTGKEILYEAAVHPQALPSTPPWVDLAPGDKSLLGFQLKEKISDLLPGDYEISAIYDYNEGEMSCESSPINLKVLPATPHNLFLASARGGASTTYYGAWTNFNEEKTEVVWGQLDLVAGGGVRNVRAIEQAGIRTQPIISVPTNGALAQGQWMAWLDKDLLHYTFLQPGIETTTPGKISLNSVAAKIVGPLHYIESTNTADGMPSGEATLLLGNVPSVTIQTLQFIGDKAELGRSAIFPSGQMPAWITNVFPTNGRQLIPYLLAEPGKLAFYILTWGDAADSTGNTELHPRLLTSLEGDFLAATCTLDSEDVIHGAILFWAGKPEESKELKLFLWTLGSKGEFSEDVLKSVSWDFTEQITKAEISVTAKGQAVAVVRKDNGQWNYIDFSGKVHPLAGNFTKTDLALAMNFLNMVKPIVIGGVQSLGLKITEPDGTPMPNLPGF